MKTTAMQIRVEPKEKEAFEEASKLAGIALSAWVRERLRSAALRELEAAGLRAAFVQKVPLRMTNDG